MFTFTFSFSAEASYSFSKMQLLYFRKTKTLFLAFKNLFRNAYLYKRTNFNQVAPLQKKNIISWNDKDNFCLHPHHSLYKWTPAPTSENPAHGYIHDFFPALLKENFCSVNENYIHCFRSPYRPRNSGSSNKPKKKK